MADDLIPPPSPAGRPQPAGTQQFSGIPRLVELPPEQPAAPLDTPPPPPQPDLPPSRFRNRFGFLIGALAGVVVASMLVLATVLATSGGTNDEGLEPNWSKWQPTDTSLEAGAAQIAEKVGAEYTHADGKQLVKVTGGPVGIGVALRPATGNISYFDGPGVLYKMNGLGQNGSIKGGTPSASRLQLIRREALELALYTFRYMPEVEMVVTLLPPPPPAEKAATPPATASPAPAPSPGASLLADPPPPEQMNAIFYRPGDLKPQLQVPLGMTVPADAPTPEKMGGPEGVIVDQLTNSNLFKWSLMQAQDMTPYLVLDRPTNP